MLVTRCVNGQNKDGTFLFQSLSSLLFRDLAFFFFAVKNRTPDRSFCPSSFQAIPPLRNKQRYLQRTETAAVGIYGKLWASSVTTFAQGWVIYRPVKWWMVDRILINYIARSVVYLERKLNIRYLLHKFTYTRIMQNLIFWQWKNPDKLVFKMY